MERYQDSRGYLIVIGVVFLGMSGLFYYSSLRSDVVHPIRNTLLFAGGAIAVCGAAALLWATIFIPILKLILRIPSRKEDAQPQDQRVSSESAPNASAAATGSNLETGKPLENHWKIARKMGNERRNCSQV